MITDTMGQHQLGMRLEKNAGINSLKLNPALVLERVSKWEFNLAGAGIFLSNNYAFLKNSNIPRLVQAGNDLEVVFQESASTQNVFEAEFYTGNERRFLNASAYVEGPGVSYKINEKSTITFFTGLRADFGSNNIPGQYSYYHITTRPFNQSFPVQPFKGAGASYLELGIGYAFKWPGFDNRLSAGFNLKYLNCYDMIFLKSNSSYTHSVINTNDFSMTDPDFSFGFSPFESLMSNSRGKGMSFDLGLSYDLISSKNGYKLKVGAAISDLGLIRYKEISRFDWQSDATFNVRGSYFNAVNNNTSLSEVTDIFIQNVIGNTGGLERLDNVNIFTPSTIQLHADYSVSKSFFVNALLAQSIQVFGAGPVRGSLLALTPRIEHPLYSFSIPVTLYQWQKLRVGLAGRLGYLTIGSDDVGSIIFRRNLSGTDLYAGLKVSFGQISERRLKMARKVKGSLECYPM